MSLQSKAFARILDLVSEGEISGLVDGDKSIYLDGTRLQNDNGTYNFKNVTIDTRTGTNSQTYITGTPSVESETNVNVEVTNIASVVRTISDSTVNAVRVTLSTPSLYKMQDDGDQKGTSVRIAIDVQTGGAGYVPQVLSQQWGNGLTLVAARTYRSNSSVYGLSIITLASISGSVEYRLVGAATWSTAGLRLVGGAGIQVESGDGYDTIPTYEVFTPTLPYGQYEIRSSEAIGYFEEGHVLRGEAYDIIDGKATSKYQRAYLINLGGTGPWDIRVRRITADTDSVKLQDKTFWDSFTSIVDAKLRYPNSAMVSMRFDASVFSGIPSRAYDMKLLKVKIPSNYNPTTRTYTGSWDGTFTTAWTDNPAWCFYDLVTNTRYGLGGYIDAGQVDKWALYTIAQYCDATVSDGFGGTEPRFTCNMYMQSRAEAYKVVQDLASCFRSMAFWASGSLTLSQDAPSDPVALYTQANVADGMFTYCGSSAKARHTVAMVTWNDPADLYTQKVEYVEDQAAIARFGVVPTEVVAIGCTSRGQAHRVGRWLLYSERYEAETVSFQTGVEGAVARPGQIIKVADSARAGVRLGGRVNSATTTAVTLDAPVTLGASAWTLYAVLPSGVVASAAVTGATGNTVDLATALAAAPAAGAQWILSTTTVEAQTFRVLTVVEHDDGKVEITALRHDPAKYNAVENNLVLLPRDITDLTPVPVAPSALTLTESLYTYQAEVRSMLSIGWPNVQGAATYRVLWSKDEGNFNETTSSVSDFDILNTTPGVYLARVYSVGPTGKVSATYAEASITALGKTAPPATVTGLAAVVDPNIGITLTWAPVADLDLNGYEITDNGTVLGIAKTTSFKVGLLPTGTKTYTVRALDTSGTYSAEAAIVSVTVTAAGLTTVSGAFIGQNLVLTWLPIQGTLATDSYEIRYGASWAAGTSLGTIKGTSFSTKASWAGIRIFWVAAIDLSGNVGTAGNFTATVASPGSVTITQETIDNNVLLKWSDATATLPLDYYELRKGTTWATASVIGRIAARFTAIFEATAGTFTYWIAGVDIAGNLGAQASVAAAVNQPPDYTLQLNQDSTFAGTKSNFVADASGFVAPVDTTETWESHFTSRGWATPQAQVTAGFPLYAEPSATAAFYEETIDYGAVLAATKVTATLTYSVTAGTPTVTPTISVKKLVGDAWTNYAGLTSVFVTDFRYVKVRYDFASVGGDDLVTVTGLNVRFDVKLKNDAGLATAVSTDSGGTLVNFTVSFVDVTSITVTPKGTAARIAVYDFVDVANPTSFKVLLFDTAGNRVSGDVSWSVKGI